MNERNVDVLVQEEIEVLKQFLLLVSFLLKPLLLILNYNTDLLIKADLIDCLIINNYQLLLISGNVGAGEREGRVISSLVSRRHFR